MRAIGKNKPGRTGRIRPVRLIFPAAWLAVVLFGPFGIAQATQDNANWQSYQKARSVVLEALRAQGGERAAASFRGLRRKGSGRLIWQGQSHNPYQVYDETPLKVASWVDFEKQRIYAEEEFAYGGRTIENLSVVLGERGYRRSTFTAGRATPLTPDQRQAVLTDLERDPACLLLRTLRAGAGLRFLGQATWHGRNHNVVSWVDTDGTLLAIYIDAQSGLVSKYEILTSQPVLGDTTNEVIWDDYRAIGGIKLPFRLILQTAGEITREIQFTEVTPVSEFPSEVFATPRDLADPSAADSMAVSQLAEGVSFVRSSHNSLIVQMKDYVVVAEAARGDEWATMVIQKARELAPNKPIRYLVNTHYHFDHTGGTRAYIAEGTTIVAHALDEEYYRKMSLAPHTIKPDRLALSPRQLQFLGVKDKWAVDDGERRVEVYAIASPHSDDMLILYLPQEKILYVSDIFSINFPPAGPIPLRFNFVPALNQELKRLGLRVEVFAPSHGRVGTEKDFEKVMASGNQ